MRVLVIPDTQIPFEHQDAIPFLAGVAGKLQPDLVVHIGDFWDQHAFSAFDDVHPSALNAEDEAGLSLERTRYCAL